MAEPGTGRSRPTIKKQTTPFEPPVTCSRQGSLAHSSVDSDLLRPVCSFRGVRRSDMVRMELPRTTPTASRILAPTIAEGTPDTLRMNQTHARALFLQAIRPKRPRTPIGVDESRQRILLP